MAKNCFETDADENDVDDDDENWLKKTAKCGVE